MSTTSKSPHSSRHNSFSNLFKLNSRNNEVENVPMERVECPNEIQLYGIDMETQSREAQQIGDDQSDGNYEDDYDELTKSATYTQNHPMGRILLDMATEEEKNKKNKNIKVERLCQNFYEAMQLDSMNRERQFAQLIKQVEENLVKRELTSHTVTMDIRPPQCFNPRATLLTMAQKNECLRLFPTRNKFGNVSKDQSVDVVEFLYAMNSAHEACKISKEEFKDMLLASTTGKPHSLIRGWISSGYDIDTIYHYLQVHFDKRLSPQEASLQLKSYRAPKSSSLADVQAHLMELASRACSQVPEGPSRTALFDLELTQSLIRSLPTESQKQVQTKFNDLSAKQRRAATAAELSQALHSIRHIIDEDIKKNGIDRHDRSHSNFRNMKNFIHKKRPTGAPINTTKPSYKANTAYVSYYPNNSWEADNHSMIEEIEGPRYNYIPRHYNVLKYYAPKTFATMNIPLRENTPLNKTGRNNINPRSNGLNRSMATSRSNFNNGQRPTLNRQQHKNGPPHSHYCSLCGKKNHLASHGCPFMIDDNGKRISVLPTHSTCSDCPPQINPRLNHPTPLCPYRKGGPFTRRR
jgi:hypothetical protein